MNTSANNEFVQMVSSLHKEGYNMDQITLQLKEKGAPENLLQEALHHLKQLRLTRKRNTGFTCCGIGVALLVIGCMLTVLLYTSGGDIKWAMYGLTSLGVVFTMKGLVDIMGW
jgi:hypothetical protein